VAPTLRRRRNRAFQYSHTTQEHPSGLLRTTVVQKSETYVLSSGATRDVPPRIDESPTRLDEAIAALPKTKRWALLHFSITNNGETIAEALRLGTAIAVSDGSYKDEFGTSALVLEGADSTNRILAANAVVGHQEDQSSFRSKLAGIYGFVVLVNTIC